jgi:hypothetical protein
MTRLVALLLALTAAAPAAPAQTRDTSLTVPLVGKGESRVNPRQWVSSTSIPVSVRDFGAYPTSAIDQTSRLQAAITYACQQTLPPSVFVPAGGYAVSATGLSVPAGCNGLKIFGEGQNATQLCGFGGAGSAPMLTVGTTGAGGSNVTDFTLEDIGFSGFCGGTFPPGIDLNCNHCHFDHVMVTGYTVFAWRFAGAASLGGNGAGFNTVSDCQVQNGAAGSFAFVIVTQGGATGGPDGNGITHCYINTNFGWVNDSVVAGATSLRSSQSFIGNRFEASAATAVVAHRGNQQDDRVVGNRYENTGAGGIIDSASNSLSTDPARYSMGNLWACGSGNCTFVDNATTHALRVGDVYGPSTNFAPPGILVEDLSQTTSGAGSPVNLKSFTLNGNSLNVAAPVLHIRAWGRAANNANAKSIQILFGGATIDSLTLTPSVADIWHCDLLFGFRSGGAQSMGGACGHGVANGAWAEVAPAATTQSFNTNIADNINIQARQVAAGDVIADGWVLALCAAPGSAGC